MDSSLIRNAVNLCLIAAVAFQPGAFAMAGGACGSFGTSALLAGNGSVTVGCQCAAVGRACECGGRTTFGKRVVAEQGKTKRADGAVRSCCASRTSRSQLAGPLSAGPLSAGPLSAGPLSAGPLSAGPLSAGLRSSSPSIEAVPTSNGVSTCMCGLRPEPLPPNTESHPQSSARSLTLIPRELEIGYVDGRLNDVFLREDQASPRAKQVPHYTQQFLCIWLI
jgi:hypothetical protein